MVRTRIAPSPTGEDLHIGSVYTALLNYAVAKKNKGQFIVRIEDTDQKRKVEGAEEKMLGSLKWFGLTPDESPVHQSERLDIYRKHAQQLIENGHAYVCDCTPERLDKIRKEMQAAKKPPRYDGHCREKAISKSQIANDKTVVRLKVPPEGQTVFKDEIRGEIRFQNKLIDDQVLLKSDGFPTYHLAVVVDDHLMKITHVIRGEEWISSTPKHVLLYKFFGWDLPIYAHHPLLRNTDKSKLSKRRNPVWVHWYREQGLLPEAILNYLALMGWSMPDERELFSLKEFVNEFSLDRLQTSAPVFDTEKLKWMNGEYFRKMKLSDFGKKIVEFIGDKYDKGIVNKTAPLVQTRIKTLAEYIPMCEFLFQSPTKYDREVNKEWIKKSAETLYSLKKWYHETMYSELSKDAETLGVSKSKYFMDIRIAIAGKKIGPPLFESMEILGKEESLTRLKKLSRP